MNLKMLAFEMLLQNIALQCRPSHTYLLTASQCQLPCTVTTINKSQAKRITLSDKYRSPLPFGSSIVEASCNVMAHAQKPHFVFRRNGRVNLNRRGRQFSRLLAAEVCASAVVMLDTPCSEVVWRVLASHPKILLLLLLLVVVVVFSPRATLGRNLSPFRLTVWLWYAASWASSYG
jgi:hypothetical protein